MGDTRPTTTEPTTGSITDQVLQFSAEQDHPGSRLSMDIIRFDRAGNPIVSVINLDTREHWWMTLHRTSPKA